MRAKKRKRREGPARAIIKGTRNIEQAEKKNREKGFVSKNTHVWTQENRRKDQSVHTFSRERSKKDLKC